MCLVQMRKIKLANPAESSHCESCKMYGGHGKQVALAWKLTDIKVLKFEVDSMIWCKREEIWNTKFYKSWLTPPKKNQILQSFVMFGGWKLTDTKVLKFGVDTKDKKVGKSCRSQSLWKLKMYGGHGKQVALALRLIQNCLSEHQEPTPGWKVKIGKSCRSQSLRKLHNVWWTWKTSSPGIASKLSSLR